jgi:hypothetical protein
MLRGVFFPDASHSTERAHVFLSYYFRFTIEALVPANEPLTQISILIVHKSASEIRSTVTYTLEIV